MRIRYVIRPTLAAFVWSPWVSAVAGAPAEMSGLWSPSRGTALQGQTPHPGDRPVRAR